MKKGLVFILLIIMMLTIIITNKVDMIYAAEPEIKWLEKEYDLVYPFTGGIAKVETNDKYGFIDHTGKEVVPLKYDDVGEPLEGLIAVELSGNWGYIDKAGEIIIPCIYEEAFCFSEGLSAVKLNNKYGYILTFPLATK